MPVMLESRSDDRMDALSTKVDDLSARMDAQSTKLNDLAAQMERGFRRVDAELREWRRETKAGFDRVDDRFERVNERFERVDDRFDRLQRLMIQFCGMMLAALIGLIATQL
jgi:hypothetical protein